MIAASAISYGLPQGSPKQIEYAADLLNQWRAACEVWLIAIADHATATSEEKSALAGRIEAAMEAAPALPAHQLIEILRDRPVGQHLAVARYAASGVRAIEEASVRVAR